MRKMIIPLTILATTVTLTLAGCSPSASIQDVPSEEGTQESTIQTPDNNLGRVNAGYVQLPDGRTVLCVSNKFGYSGGISCDWESIKEELPAK